jgi:aminoglycoside 3-N-acetyltransferase
MELEKGLRALGVQPGMMLEVHCALSSFGHVAGGASTVIKALQHVVGADGAIVMPSFRLSPNLPLDDEDKRLGLTLKIRILKEDEGPTAMGAVADTFRKMPDVVTGQGAFRVSAWGKDARTHAQGFQHVIDSGGYALLLGVDIYRMSAMHYAEDSMPVAIKARFKASDEAQTRYPASDWFIEAWQPAAKPWYTIQARAYAKGYIADATIGNSKCMLVQVRHTLALYRSALQNEAFALYGLT